MKCEKCGNTINSLLANHFMRDGTDRFDEVLPIETGEAVALYMRTNYTGTDLSDEEQVDCIKCPVCGKFPFIDTESQREELIRVVFFTTSKDSPTADVVKVVRCGECEHKTDHDKGWLWCCKHNGSMDETDFCSYGEREKLCE